MNLSLVDWLTHYVPRVTAAIYIRSRSRWVAVNNMQLNVLENRGLDRLVKKKQKMAGRVHMSRRLMWVRFLYRVASWRKLFFPFFFSVAIWTPSSL